MRAAVCTSLAAMVLAGSVQAEEDGAAPADANRPDMTRQEQAAEREALEPAVTTAMPPAESPGESRRAMDELDLERTEITGNRELPKVLYIVPWRKADPGDLAGRPVNTLIEEVLAPLDREEFIRQVDYYSDLNDSDGLGEELEQQR